MKINKKMFWTVFILSIAYVSISTWMDGDYYYLKPQDPTLYEAVKRDFFYEGRFMRMSLSSIMENVIKQQHHFIKKPSHKASCLLGIWIPENQNVQIRIKELSMKSGEKEIPFETGLLNWDLWDGGKFDRKFNWKEDVLNFPKDGVRRGIFDVAYIGLNQIGLRGVRNRQFTFKLTVEARSGDQTEVYTKTFELTKTKMHMSVLFRILVWEDLM